MGTIWVNGILWLLQCLFFWCTIKLVFLTSEAEHLQCLSLKEETPFRVHMEETCLFLIGFDGDFISGEWHVRCCFVVIFHLFTFSHLQFDRSCSSLQQPVTSIHKILEESEQQWGHIHSKNISLEIKSHGTVLVWLSSWLSCWNSGMVFLILFFGLFYRPLETI